MPTENVLVDVPRDAWARAAQNAGTAAISVIVCPTLTWPTGWLLAATQPAGAVNTGFPLNDGATQFEVPAGESLWLRVMPEPYQHVGVHPVLVARPA